MENLKTKIPRSEEYLEWIRSKKCIVCLKRPVVPHHSETGGYGIKGSDFAAVPLCGVHHGEVHNNGKMTFQEEHGVDFVYEVRTLNGKWRDKLDENETT